MAQSGETVQSAGDATAEKTPSMLMGIVDEIIYSPLNLILVAVIGFLVYKIVRDRFEVPKFKAGDAAAQTPELPKIRRDFTIQELRAYDGNGTDGRILIAVNGFVYDVSKQRRFYGPGGPYASFAGRDASRNLATFSVEPNDKDEPDDLSDLSPMEMDSVKEWEMQFKEKYDLVGKLLRKGEQPTNYADEEDDTTDTGPETTATESNIGAKKDDASTDDVKKRAASTTEKDVK